MSAPLPWANDAAAASPDPLADVAAKLALLGAARALVRAGAAAPDDDAEATVTAALRDMTPEGRVEAAARLRQTQSRLEAALRRLRDEGGEVTADRVMALMKDT